MSDFYVYAYIDPRNGTPFYIGKGRAKRAWKHLQQDRLRKKGFFQNKLRRLLREEHTPSITMLAEGLSEEMSFILESFFILALGRRRDSNNLGPLCNLTNGGEGPSGYRHSKETLRRLSDARRRENLSAETLRKMSQASRSREVSLETRRRISESQRGKKLTPEHRRKLSEVNTGKSLSEGHRRKLSEANKGRPLSEEHRRKLSDAKKGTKHAPETRHRISEALKGHRLSEETKQKISIAHRLRHAFGKEPWQPAPSSLAAYHQCLEAWLSDRNSGEVSCA
jgi:hypothetical protein